MNGLVLWPVGLVASVGLHVGVVLVLPLWLGPEPIADQPRPQSELRIETQDVARSESAAIPPPSEPMAIEKPNGAAVNQGAIPQSRATASTLTAEPLTSAPPNAASLATTTPAIATVIAASPESQTVALTPPKAAQVLAAAVVPENAILAEPISASVTIASDTVAATMPVSAVAPDGPAVAAIVPDAPSVPSGPLPEDQITAALAWSGGAESQIDAQALATIQSFMRAGDIGSQSGDVRDAMSDLLSQVPCARLQAEFDPATGTIALRGHIPEEGLRGPVLEALQAQVGQGLPVVDAMLILPRPQCGALSGIGAVGLPQSTDQLSNPLLVGADAHARAYDYQGGEFLSLDIAQAPDYDSYIYVDYFDAAGNVIHLIPNDAVPLTLHPAKSAMTIDRGPDGRPIEIGPPYGQEIAVAYAASAPLYVSLRPAVEPAEPYLAWLQEQVAAARANHPDFKGEWVYFFVSTRTN